MKFIEPYIENLMIYIENVSYFSVFCVFASFLAVLMTWKMDTLESQDEKTPEQSDEKDDINESDQLSACESDYQESSEMPDLARMKPSSAEKRGLIESVAHTLTQTDLVKEKEIEMQQLNNILELMKRDRDKFKIETMQELEEQMKLYRE